MEWINFEDLNTLQIYYQHMDNFINYIFQRNVKFSAHSFVILMQSMEYDVIYINDVRKYQYKFICVKVKEMTMYIMVWPEQGITQVIVKKGMNAWNLQQNIDQDLSNSSPQYIILDF